MARGWNGGGADGRSSGGGTGDGRGWVVVTVDEGWQRWWNVQWAEATPGVAVQVLLGEAEAAAAVAARLGACGGSR